MAINPAIFLEKAKLLTEQHRYADAEREVKKMLEQVPDSADALGLLGRIKIDNGEPQKGLNYVNQALEIIPEEDYFHYLKGFALYHLDRPAEAITAVQEAISLNPWMPGYYGLYAFVHILNRSFEAALQKANEGLAIDPEDVSCLNARTQALVKLNRSGEAFETIHQTLASDPENDYSHTNAGYSYLEKGKHQQAAYHFREALRIHPGNMHARDGMKDALRSRIAPFRWLLQYEYWLQNKGRNMRIIFIIGLFIAVRLLAFAASGVPKALAMVFYAIFFLYIAAALLSWVIKPFANLFLCFHPEGKYAVTYDEKINSFTVMGAIGLGLTLLLAGLLLPTDTTANRLLVQAGLLTGSLALPLSYIHWPLAYFKQSKRQWIGIITVLWGTTTLGVTLAGDGTALAKGMLTVYLPVWILGNWFAALSKK